MVTQKLVQYQHIQSYPSSTYLYSEGVRLELLDWFNLCKEVPGLHLDRITTTSFHIPSNSPPINILPQQYRLTDSAVLQPQTNRSSIRRIQPTRCDVSLFISVRRSTCFRRVFRPSSSEQNCTYSVRYLSGQYCYLLLA